MATDATGLDLTISIAGGGTLTRALDLVTATETLDIGGDEDVWPEMVSSYEFGTGSGQINNWWTDERTLAATTGESIDLSGALANALSGAVFSKVKIVIIDIDTPDDVKTLRFGPQGVTNAAPLCFGDASDYLSLTTRVVVEEPFTGWTITAGTGDLLRVYNPSASSVTYRILVGGIS